MDKLRESDRPASTGARETTPRVRRSGQRRPGRARRGDGIGGFFLWLAKYLAFGVILLLVHLLAGLAALYVHRSRNVPPTPTRKRARSAAQALTRIWGGDGRLIGEFAAEWRHWAPYDEIPKRLIQAFVAVEDRRFYEHRGIDWRGLFRAATVNLSTGRIVQGGSTITQQLAKTYIGAERTVDRKIREAILATRIEASMSKSDILELYLNRIFLGNGAYGVAAAARRYFDKRLDQLTLAEAALIAGLARAPSRYNPFRRPDKALARRNQVLGHMREEGYISKQEYLQATRSRTRRGPDGKPVPDLGLRRRPNFYQRVCPYFTEHVRQEVIRRFGRERFDRGGLRVETTVDTQIQALARGNVDELSRWIDKRQGWRGPVAYLQHPDARAEFRKVSAARDGDAPLKPGRRYLGLVERSVTRGAVVTVGRRRYTLPRRFLRWGARFYTRSEANDRFIDHAWLVLMPGDVVWVRLAPSKVYDPLIPGSDGGPSVRSPQYRPPPGHAHDGRPPGRVLPLDLPHGPEWPGPPYLALEQTPRVQGTLFTFDMQSGYVKAMVGGNDFDRSAFNRAAQACRQPGSTYKPVYYSLAMDRGYSFHKPLKDKPYSITDPKTGRVWYVSDYQYNQDARVAFDKAMRNYTTTLEHALVWSKNTASVNLFLELGAENVKRWARRLGFTTEIIADEALALGASCTRLDELSRAFAIFGNGGREKEPIYIRRVIDRHGRVLLDNTVPADPLLPPGDRFDRLFAWAGKRHPQVISPKTAHRTATLMRRMVQKGHAAVLRMTGIPAAGKTGTASRTADTWFVGWTSRWLTTAWLGDDNYVRPLGRFDASFTTALPMWSRFMFDAARYHPLREIPWLDARGRPLKLKPVVPALLPRTHKPDYQPHFKRRKARTKP